MSQQLMLDLSDEMYENLRQRASAAGLSLTDLIISTLDQKDDRPAEDTRTEAEKEESRQRFRRHAGAVDLGYPTGADNESIDADLARAYANEY